MSLRSLPVRDESDANGAERGEPLVLRNCSVGDKDLRWRAVMTRVVEKLLSIVLL